MKLSKAASQAHQRALDLVHSDRELAYTERLFILENYVEAQGQLNSLAGAFFTPLEMAFALAVEVPDDTRTLIDLCAGIGSLSFACEQKAKEITCIEACAAYVEAGKRVLPQARWIHADVFSAPLGRYDVAISNPPFGAIAAPSFSGDFTGSDFEYKVIELASRCARYGVFILPRTSTPFRQSGQPSCKFSESNKAKKFREQTGIQLEPSCIDTAEFNNAWRGVSPFCEVALCDFEEGNFSHNQQPELLEAA